MSYIPVGTTLTYSATWKFFSGTLGLNNVSWQSMAARLSNDLPNLQGQEDLEVSSPNGSTGTLAGTESLTIQVYNNGVDHASEFDIASIINGVIQGYGVTVVNGAITAFTLPNNPDDLSNDPDNVQAGQTVITGAVNAVAPATTASSGNSLLSSLSLGNLSGGSIFGISTTVVILGIVALILLLPGGFGRAVRAVR